LSIVDLLELVRFVFEVVDVLFELLGVQLLVLLGVLDVIDLRHEVCKFV
jgi:hypothetical protein